MEGWLERCHEAIGTISHIPRPAAFTQGSCDSVLTFCQGIDLSRSNRGIDYKYSADARSRGRYVTITSRGGTWLGSWSSSAAGLPLDGTDSRVGHLAISVEA